MNEEDERLIPRALHLLTIAIMIGFVMSSVLAVMLLSKLKVAPEDVRREVMHVGESVDNLQTIVDERTHRLDDFDAFIERVEEGMADRWTATQEREWQEALFEANPELKRPNK